MKQLFTFCVIGVVSLYLLLLSPTARSQQGTTAAADDFVTGLAQIFLPIANNGVGSATTLTPTTTPTLISTAPATPANTITPIPTATTTGTATATTTGTAPPAPTITATATAADTATPTLTSTATTTPTVTTTPSPTPTPTATSTATATGTSTSTPTSTVMPTTTPTSIAFPDLTFSCTAEPATNNSRLLKITVQPVTQAPSAASFKFVPTQLAGPIDDILQPGPFQLVNIFTGQTSATSPGALTRCDTENLCTATYTLTETSVTRYIGTTIDCQF